MTEPQRRRINENLRALENKVLALFGATYVNALNIPEIKAVVNAEDDEFDWSKYKGAEGKIEKMLRKLSLDLNTLVTSAVAAEYEHGADGAFKEVGSMLGKTKAQRELVEQVCEQATNQRREQGHTGWNYVQGRRGGLTLSERIWQSTRQAKQELRIMVQSGVIEGKTAQEISQDVRPNLIEPKRLFRRVRDKETGELRLSKAAKEYHPGQGVYRSSFKNAMRVARTEVNQAYRVGEQQSYTNNPLVKGYEIMTSENNHTTTTTNGKKVPLKDICDRLAGIYPKTFVWSGWHPNCRCKMVPIPLTPEEFGEYMRKKKAGKLNEWRDPSVKTMPKNFRDWVSDHSEQIQAAADNHRLPYFLLDNPKAWGAGAPTPAELAAQRHAARTPEMEQDIRDRWAEHQRIQAEVKKIMEEMSAMYPTGAMTVEKGSDGYKLAQQVANQIMRDAEKEYRDYGSGVNAHSVAIDSLGGFLRDMSGADGLAKLVAATVEKSMRPYGRVARVSSAQAWMLASEAVKQGVRSDYVDRIKRLYYEEQRERAAKASSRSDYDANFVRSKTKVEVGARVTDEKGRQGQIVEVITKSTGYVKILYDSGSTRKAMAFNLRGEDGYPLKKRPKDSSESNHSVNSVNSVNPVTYEEAYKTYKRRKEKQERIKYAADKRHAERTPEREKEIRDFWENKKAEGEKRRRREQILEEAAKRHAARTPEQAQAIIDKLEKRRNQYAEWEKNIRDTEKRAKINEWVTDEDSAIWVDGDRGTRYHLRDYNEIAQELNRRMDVIDKLRGSWYLAAMHQSVFDSYREKLDEARRMITNGFEKNALDAMEIAKEIRAIESRYVDMRTYQKAHPGKGGNKSKIELALDEAEALVKQGDIKGAELKIKEAENTRKINEASAKAKAEAARKKKEEAERLKAEEEARKNKQLRHEDCETIEDFRRLYGDDMPVISQHIDTSVKRDAYTASRYLNSRDEIERKLKEFWKEVDFSHCTDPRALDGYFKDGILTNLQRDGDTNTGYAAGRRAYGHFAFDLPGDPGDNLAKIPKKYHLKPGEYYRCGVPCSKDPYEAFTRDNSGYGDAQLVFRRDRIITTFTMGNSLGQKTIPSLTTDPKVCSLDSKAVPNINDAKYTIESLRAGNGYCEVQYLPRRSQGNFTPKDFQRITMREHPERYHPKELWKKWADEGVDIYYIDRNKKKAILYMKGKPQMTHTEAKSVLDGYKSELDLLLKDAGRMSNKDVSIAEMQAKIKSGDYIGALEDYQRFKDVEARRQKIVDLIPDADKFHKEFTIDELEAAHRAIKAKLDYMDNTFKARNTPDDVLNKWAEEIDKAEHPEKYKAGSKRFPTWEIAKNAYVRRRNQLVYEFHKTKIDDDLRSLRSSNSKNKEFLMKMTELEDKVKTGEWATVETIIEDARAILKRTGEIVLKLGESSKIRFSAEEFSQAARDAAKWFKDPNVKAAYKAADDYMSKYAQDMWKSLTDEEKHVLWLYTDGSKYINEEMLGLYGLRCISPFDGTVRNGLADANVVTSIIEKAPALKESMWMQSGKSLGAFKAMFGIDISSVSDPSKLVGMVGTNNIFSSCHASSDGYFTKGGSTGTSNPIVMSIYMPKGTKGVYLEPFASYGDNLRWKKGLSWTGTKRREAPSDQVEFLLQRGAKFKITKAYYSNGKWYVDVDLIEQSAVDALNETIPGLMNRPTRISRKPTLI